MITKMIIENGVLSEYDGDEKRITIPDGVVIIKDMAIHNRLCEEVVLPESLESIGAGAFTGSRLKQVKIPSRVKEIRDSAFHECGMLKKVVFSVGLEEIGFHGFCGNACKDIVLPESLKYIGEGAFCDCRNLETIVVPQSVVQIEKWAFAMNSKLKRLVLPARFMNSKKDFFREGDILPRIIEYI